MTTTTTATDTTADRFQTRDELVRFIEDHTTTAVEKAARAAPARRVPWSRPAPCIRTPSATRC